MNDLFNIKNLDDILQLGEGQYIEFKEIFNKHVIETIVAFANTQGGNILIGVNDKKQK